MILKLCVSSKPIKNLGNSTTAWTTRMKRSNKNEKSPIKNAMILESGKY